MQWKSSRPTPRGKSTSTATHYENSCTVVPGEKYFDSYPFRDRNATATAGACPVANHVPGARAGAGCGSAQSGKRGAWASVHRFSVPSSSLGMRFPGRFLEVSARGIRRVRMEVDGIFLGALIATSESARCPKPSTLFYVTARRVLCHR